MKNCDVRQAGDRSWCDTCGQQWDTNDSDEPPCPFDPVDPIKPYPTADQIAAVGQMVIAFAAIVLGYAFSDTVSIMSGVVLALTARLHLK